MQKKGGEERDKYVGREKRRRMLGISKKGGWRKGEEERKVDEGRKREE